MPLLRGYAVLKAVPAGEQSYEDNRPYCIVRVVVDPVTSTTTHTIVADHSSFNLARYWAHQLNDGSETEESALQQIAEARQHVGLRGR